MFIEAETGSGERIMLNTKYIVDIWGIDKPIASAYVIGDPATEYKIKHEDVERIRVTELMKG